MHSIKVSLHLTVCFTVKSYIQALTSIEPKHRGFGFVTYTSAGDAQDAIDNMDLNELRGRVLRVNLAKPQLVPTAGLGNRASMYFYLT